MSNFWTKFFFTKFQRQLLRL